MWPLTIRLPSKRMFLRLSTLPFPSKPDLAAPVGEQTRILKTAAFRRKNVRESGVYPAFPVVGIGLRVARTGGRSVA